LQSFVIIVLLIIVVSFFWQKSKRDSQSSHSTMRSRTITPLKPTHYEVSELPSGLGLLESVPLGEAVSRLDASLPPEFMEQLLYRVTTKHKNLTADEFTCKMLELKRFFMMNLILKRTPMFSEEVDDIWHEMLMFTRDYQRFGDQFTGAPIHHAPEREPQQMPGERAWFDWMYAHLFAFTPYSSSIWNGFFRYPLDRERLDVLKRGDEQEIAELWFDLKNAERYPEVKQTMDLLIQQAIYEARHAESSSNFQQTEWYNQSGVMNMTYLAGAMMFFSIADNSDSSDFSSSMDSVIPEDSNMQRKDTSSCSSSGCASSGSSDNGGSSGDSGGASSCSSGSSCSSSSGSSCSSSSGSSCGSSCSS
jgi:hypothetical protein